MNITYFYASKHLCSATLVFPRRGIFFFRHLLIFIIHQLMVMYIDLLFFFIFESIYSCVEYLFYLCFFISFLLIVKPMFYHLLTCKSAIEYCCLLQTLAVIYTFYDMNQYFLLSLYMNL